MAGDKRTYTVQLIGSLIVGLLIVVVTISIVTVVWTVIGYTLAFGTDLGGGLLGGFDACILCWRPTSRPSAVPSSSTERPAPPARSATSPG